MPSAHDALPRAVWTPNGQVTLPNIKPIVEQFVKGIKAWVAIAEKNLPVELHILPRRAGTLELGVLSRAEGFPMGVQRARRVSRRLTDLVGAERAVPLLLGANNFRFQSPAWIDLGIS